MSVAHGRLLLAACLTLPLALLASGQASAPLGRQSAGVEKHREPASSGLLGRFGKKCPDETEAVLALAISPDGKLLLAAHRDRTLRLWNIPSGKELTRLHGHDRPVGVVAFSPNGKRVLSANVTEVCLWDAATGKRVQSFRPQGERILHTAYSADGRPLAWTADARHTLRMREVTTGVERGRFEGHTGRIRGVSPALDGALVATAADDKTVRLWDATTGKEMRRLEGHAGQVLELKFAPNGWALCGVGPNHTRCIWETNCGAILANEFPQGARDPFPLPKKQEGRYQTLVFTPDSAWLAHVADVSPKVAAYWDISSWAISSSDSGSPLTESGGKLTCLAFAPDGTRLAAGGADGVVSLWKMPPGGTAGWRTNWHRGAKYLEGLWHDLGTTVGRKVYDALWGLVQARGEVVAFIAERLRPVRDLPAGEVRKLLTELDDSRRATRDRAFAQLLELNVSARPELERTLRGQPGAEVRLRVEMLLEACDETQLTRAVRLLEQLHTVRARRLLEVVARGKAEAGLTREARAALRRLGSRPAVPDPPEWPAKQPPAPDLEGFVAVPDRGRDAPPRTGFDRLGDPLPRGARARAGTARFRHVGDVQATAFSPDGSSLATASYGGVVIWETSSGRRLHYFPCSSSYLTCVTFSPDGKILAARERRGCILRWDLTTGRELDALDSGHVSVHALAFSPDGKLLAAGGEQRVIVWKTATGARLHVRHDLPGYLYALASTGDGKALVLATDRGLRWHDLATWQELRTIEVRGLSAAVASPDGTMLAGVEGRGTLRVWELATGREVHNHVEALSVHTRIALGPAGKHVAATSQQQDHLLVYDLATRKNRWLSGGYRSVQLAALAFAPDGKTLVSAGNERQVRLWDVPTGKQRHNHLGVEGPALLSPDGKLIAAHAETGVLLWDTATGKPVRRVGIKGKGLTAMAVAPAGGVLVCAVEDWKGDTLAFQELATGKVLRHFGRHRGHVTFLTCSPDGKALASADSADGSVYLWDTTTGAELRRLAGTEREVNTGAFQPGGRILVTGGEDGMLRAWEIATGKELHRWQGHGGYAVSAAIFSVDGKYLLTAGSDGFVSVWDAQSWRWQRRFEIAQQWHAPIASSPDGLLLAAPTEGGTVSVWEIATGKLRHRWGPCGARSLAFTPDGKRLVSAGWDGTALVWELGVLGAPQRPSAPQRARSEALPPGALARLGTFRFRCDGSPWSAAFSPDGKVLAVLATDSGKGTVYLWSVATAKELGRFAAGRGAQQVAYAPDGRSLAVAGEASLTVWDADGRRRLCMVRAPADGVPAFAFSPDSRLLATCGGGDAQNKDCTVRLWDAGTGAEVVRLLFSHGTPVRKVAFSADGKWLLSVSATVQANDGSGLIFPGHVCIWQLATGKLHRRLPTRGESVGFLPDGRTAVFLEAEKVHVWDLFADKLLWRLEEKVSDWRVSPDGKLLATGQEDKAMRLWDALTGKEVRRFQGWPALASQPLCFSADGKLIASLRSWWKGSGPVRLWDATAGEELPSSTGHGVPVTCVAWSPDGKTLATGNEDATLRLWRTDGGRELHHWTAHAAPVKAVVFSPKGKYLASAGGDEVVRIWDRRGKELHRLEGHTGGVKALAFAADGQALITGSGDGTVRRFRTGSWETVQQFKAHREVMSLLAISPDGHRLASVGKDGPGQFTEHVRRLWKGASFKDLKSPEDEPQARGFEFATTAAENVLFSGDGRFLASTQHTHGRHGPRNHKTRVWEVATGREVLCINWEWSSALLAFSPDARHLLLPAFSRLTSGGPAPASLQAWDLVAQTELRPVAGHYANVTAAAFSPDGKRVASASADGTVLLWHAAALTRSRGSAEPAELPPGGVEKLWADLGGVDAAAAFRAMWALAAVPDRAMPLLHRHLKPVPAVDARKLAGLVADLASARFAIREKAMQALDKLGDVARPVLEEALQKRPPLEVRRRVEQLLGRLEVELSPPQVRVVRAIAVLERSATPAARRLLHRLAAGAPGARMTVEAQAALRRLAPGAAAPQHRDPAEGQP